MNRIWAGLLCALAASWVSAQEGYGPYGSGRSRYDYPFYSNVYAVLSPNLAIEGRLGGGLSSAQANNYGIEVHSLFAGYLKGSVPLAPGFSLYGLGGVANVDLQRDFGRAYANDTGLSYGLGMDFDLASNARLSLEWTHLATGDNLGYGYDVSQASISMAWRF